jgi:hypothetical protein
VVLVCDDDQLEARLLKPAAQPAATVAADELELQPHLPLERPVAQAEGV